MSEGTHDTVREIRHGDRDTLARHVAGSLAEALQSSLQQRSHASLIVPGGSTPVPVFRVLREQTLPWSRVRVSLSDERWVPPTSHDSNEHLVCRELLQGKAAAAQLIGLTSAIETPWLAVNDCARRLAQLPRPFDAVLLGMGDDGHTASLFPGSDALVSGLDHEHGEDCVASHPEGIPQPRLSLGLHALLDSRLLILCFFGESKWQVYQEALTADPMQMPVAAVLRQTRTPVTVHWAP